MIHDPETLDREQGHFLHLLVESIMPHVNHDRVRAYRLVREAGGAAVLYRCGLPAADVAHAILGGTGGLR